jgi:hypothetical protein
MMQAVYMEAVEVAEEGLAKEVSGTVHCNIAAVYGKQGKWQEVVKHASDCISCLPSGHPLVVKALWRRGEAYRELKDLERAVPDYQKVGRSQF